MNNGLKTAIATTCANHLKYLLLIQQELVTDRKEKGIKIYSLKEYNKEIETLFTNGINYHSNTLNLIKIIETELSSNLYLTKEEIDEITTRFQNGLIKFGLKQECYNIGFDLLVRDIIEHDIVENKNKAFENGDYLLYHDKWEYIINSKNTLGIPDKIIPYYSYDNYFSICDTFRNYICQLDENGKDITNDINSFRRSKKQNYLAKNIFLVLLNNTEEDIVYKTKDVYQSILYSNKKYSEDVLLNIETFNSLLTKAGLSTEEIYNEREIFDNINRLEKYINNQNNIDILVLNTTNYLQQIIFDTSNLFTYQNYTTLIPTYTEKQIEALKKELSKLIKTNLLKEEKLELNFVPSYNNQLINLLNNLFILPSPNVIGKIIEVDLNENKVKVIDKSIKEEQIIYPLSKNIKQKKL